MATVTLKKVELVAPGEYPCKVVGLKQVAGARPDWSDQYEFEFELQDGRTLRAWTSDKYTSGSKPSKLYLWTTALLGEAPDEFDPMVDLLGKKALATVVVEPRRDAPDTMVNKIHSLRRLQPQQRQTAPTARQDATAQAMRVVPQVQKTVAVPEPPPIDFDTLDEEAEGGEVELW